MSSHSVFVIVGKHDNPVFEMSFGQKREDQRHLSQFIIHAALDNVDERMWQTGSMNLKAIDRFNNMYISAYVTPSGSRFMLLHEKRDDDGVRSFFQEVHEMYIKYLLSPFNEPNDPIKSPAFEHRVRLLGKKVF